MSIYCTVQYMTEQQVGNFLKIKHAVYIHLAGENTVHCLVEPNYPTFRKTMGIKPIIQYTVLCRASYPAPSPKWLRPAARRPSSWGRRRGRPAASHLPGTRDTSVNAQTHTKICPCCAKLIWMNEMNEWMIEWMIECMKCMNEMHELIKLMNEMNE